MGHNGSRVIQIKNVEEHLNQCETTGRKSKIQRIQGAPSMDSCIAYAIKAWTSTSQRVKLAIHLIPCLSIILFSPTISSSHNLPSSKTLIHHLSMNFSLSFAEFVKW